MLAPARSLSKKKVKLKKSKLSFKDRQKWHNKWIKLHNDKYLIQNDSNVSKCCDRYTRR